MSRCLCLVVLGFSFWAPLLRAAGPLPIRPTPDQIATWIKELGADDFDTREAATKKLRAAGERAEAALEKAADSTDREVSRRARAILGDFKWGIFPDTPEAVVELIKAYQSASKSEKEGVIRKLVTHGRPGWRALTRIARAEEDPLVRKDVFALLAADLSRAVPVMLAEEDYTGLEGLLDLGLAGDLRSGISNYTAYWLLRGKLDDRIAHFRALAKKNPPGKVQAEILTYLYRAKGDRAAALKAAQDAERNDLEEALLYEAGNWKALADRPELMGATDPIEKLGLRAAYSRLSGNEKEYAACIAELRKKAEGKEEVHGLMPVQLAKALFLNAQPALALEVLERSKQFDILCLEVHLARFDLKAARTLVERVRKEKGQDVPAVEVIWARALYSLGEKEEALKVFKGYSEKIKKGSDFAWFLDLVEAEVRCGLADLAMQHAGAVLATSDDEGWPRRLFDKLLPSKGKEGAHLYRYLRAKGDDAGTAVKKACSFLQGKSAPREVKELLEGAFKEGAATKLSQAGWQALGEAAWAGKQEEQARKCFATADTASALIRLGDTFAEKKEWEKAAAAYLTAYEKAVKELPEARLEEDGQANAPLALYLSGDALVKAGKAEAGKRRVEQAHWLPLGNASVRADFLHALLRRNLLEAARREVDLLLRTGEPALHEPESFQVAEAQRVAAVDAALRKQHAAAALGYEQAVLRVLRPTINFSRPVAYVAVPGFIHRHRAQGLLATDKVEEALSEVGRSQSVQPGNIEAVVHLVPELEGKGRKKDADKVYSEAQGVYERVLKEFPRCAWAYNSSAWLSACCKRDLEGALTRARKAVELNPDSAGYHDTLAEVLFQLGKKDEAVAAQKKAVALDPKRVYFQKQLKRLEAGDARAPRPAEDGEE